MQDHPKDAEFLNVAIVNYQYMQTIFGCGGATGRFAMGSNEPLGQPTPEPATIDVDKENATTVAKEDNCAIKDKRRQRTARRGRGCSMKKMWL